MFELILLILAAAGVFLMYQALSAFGGPALQPPPKPKATNVKGAGVAKKHKPSKAELAAEARQKQQEDQFIARELANSNKGLARDSGSARPVSLDEHKRALAAKEDQNKPTTANQVVDAEKARNQAKAQGFNLVEEKQQEISTSKKQKLKKIADAQAAFASETSAAVERRARRRNTDDDLNKDRDQAVAEEVATPDWQIMTRKELLDRKMSKFFGGGRRRDAPRRGDAEKNEENNSNNKPVKGNGKVSLKSTFDAKKMWTSSKNAPINTLEGGDE